MQPTQIKKKLLLHLIEAAGSNLQLSRALAQFPLHLFEGGAFAQTSLAHIGNQIVSVATMRGHDLFEASRTVAVAVAPLPLLAHNFHRLEASIGETDHLAAQGLAHL